MITAVVPAHNEGANLSSTIEGLRNQTVPPDHIIVVSDNSTDNTVEVARTLGVEVIETVGNVGRKAGALNQALAYCKPHRDDLLLVMDADTIIVPTWLETALQELHDPTVGACGAVFSADHDEGWLQRCQSMEWERFAETIERTGKTFVLSGTASLIRFSALEDVREKFGQWYREDCIVEDFMATCDLLACGWELRSPIECTSITETMPSIPTLYRQRRRWYQGAMQVCGEHGLKPYMLVYWRQQLFITLSIIGFWLCWGITFWATAVFGLLIHPLWIVVGLIFWAERIVTARSHRIYAATMLPEIGYAIVLQAAFMVSLFKHLTGGKVGWSHL